MRMSLKKIDAENSMVTTFSRNTLVVHITDISESI